MRDTFLKRPPEFEKALKEADSLAVYETRNPVLCHIQKALYEKDPSWASEKYQKAKAPPLVISDSLEKSQTQGHGDTKTPTDKALEQHKTIFTEGSITDFEAAAKSYVDAIKKLDLPQLKTIFDAETQKARNLALKTLQDSKPGVTIVDTAERLVALFPEVFPLPPPVQEATLAKPELELISFNAPEENSQQLRALETATSRAALSAAHEKIMADEDIDPEFAETVKSVYDRKFDELESQPKT